MIKKILIVDDDRDIVTLLAKRLQSNNYEVMVAVDAIEAKKKAFTQKPDLILLDYTLPAGTGIRIFEELKKSTNTMIIPVIFVTANPNEEIKERALQMGASDYIAKPFVPEELLSKIKQCIGESS